MNNAISLVESRTFWSAALALFAIVAKTFGWTHALSFAVDPSVLDNIMNGVMMLGTIGSMVFRAKATSRVMSVLPPSVSSMPPPGK